MANKNYKILDLVQRIKGMVRVKKKRKNNVEINIDEYYDYHIEEHNHNGKEK